MQNTKIKYAERPLFLIDSEKKNIKFEWFGGFAFAQKQKSIAEFHKQSKQEIPNLKILEVSTKSPEEKLGKLLSAFNLMLQYRGKPYSVEFLYQTSKVYKKKDEQETFTDDGLPRYKAHYFEIFYAHYKNNKEYMLKVREAIKKNEEDKNYQLAGYKYNHEYWKLNDPKDERSFYNWLYINALLENPELSRALEKYDAFTDIEFNPKKSKNCQANACAIFRKYQKRGQLQSFLDEIKNFLVY